ncbi:hypothetical protein V2J09_023308 [Rumex salicifolius]
MLKQELSGGANPTWVRVCDTCRSSPSRVYCTADAAYLCASCDARLHASAPGHDRVWVCESCERLPAAFVCKADAASLCADCDARVHSANPLASRHQRFPISGCLYGAPATNLGRRLFGSVPTVGDTADGFDEDDEDEAASWLISNPSNNNNNNMSKDTNNKNGCSLGGEVVDEYLDLVEFDIGGGDNGKLNNESYKHHDIQHSHHEHHQYTVPIGVGQGNEHMHEQHSFQMNLDYDRVKSDHFAYNNGLSMAHSMSVSSLDVGVVPESTTSEMSTSHVRSSKGTIALFSSNTTPLQQIPTQLSPMDREARVLRYREKKKTRKFEKTIRYASRKAYAEMRPRIKGRFAKRTNIEAEADQMYSNTIMVETGYGVVPSF